MHRKDKWVAYAQCLNEGMTLQAAVDECHINLKMEASLSSLCINNWRDKVIRIVEADEMFIAESFKGSRHLEREPRKHGGIEHGLPPLVSVLIALDRDEH